MTASPATPAPNAVLATAPRGIRRGSVAKRLAGVVIVAAVVVAAVVVVRPSRPSALTRAQHLVHRDSRFVNGPKAGAAFADISTMMLADAKACRRAHGASDNRCAARYSAAAFTSVTAFVLLHCTQPGVYEARRDLLAELAGIADVDRRHGVAVPPPVPPLPVCS